MDTKHGLGYHMQRKQCNTVHCMFYLPRYLTGGLGPRFLLPFGGVTGSAGSEGHNK